VQGATASPAGCPAWRIRQTGFWPQRRRLRRPLPGSRSSLDEPFSRWLLFERKKAYFDPVVLAYPFGEVPPQPARDLMHASLRRCDRTEVFRPVVGGELPNLPSRNHR
jgi:hypothetical protein